MQNLNDLILFVQAVESGGFAAAARRLGCPRSTVAKRISELETRLDARLLHRSSRSFVLTDIGREVFEHARAAMIEAEAAERAVATRRAEPSGVVRITASVPSAQLDLAPRLPALARAYPRLQVQLHVTDRFVDLRQEGFDIAVRSHFAPLPDSDLVARQMRVEPFLLIAAPSYLAARGTPATPDDLAAHDGLLAYADRTRWTLVARDGATAAVAPQPRFFADESVALLEAAKAGLGIASLPQHFSAPMRDAGALVVVLPGWHAGTVTTTLLTTHRRGQLPSVRATIDFLCNEKGPPSPAGLSQSSLS